MFGSLLNLAEGITKVAVGVVVTPVALVKDIVTLPLNADDYHKGPFDSTSKALGLIGEGIDDATKGEKE
jgi:hypothetical protein